MSGEPAAQYQTANDILVISCVTDDDGTCHYRLVGEFPERAAFDPHLLMGSYTDVIGVTVIVTVNLENGSATYAWRNDLDKSDHGAFVMRRVAAWDKEHADGTE